MFDSPFRTLLFAGLFIIGMTACIGPMRYDQRVVPTGGGEVYIRVDRISGAAFIKHDEGAWQDFGTKQDLLYTYPWWNEGQRYSESAADDGKSPFTYAAYAVNELFTLGTEVLQ